MFGNENPVGQTVRRNNGPVIIAGVYEDVVNSHLVFDAVLSLKSLFDPERFGWSNPNPFMGYLKLHKGVSPADTEAKIAAILPQFMNIEAEKAAGNTYEFFLNPVTKLHSSNADTKQIVLVLSILAFALLFVAAMNYVLISISSLAKRAKAIGVHKCNGASENSIFRLFIYETAILLFIAFILSVLVIFTFKETIENIIETPLSALFSMQNLWVVGVVTISLLILSGIIPAFIFSSVPVTHVFRMYTTDKRYWKRSLLFVQFTGITFIVTLLIVIIKQYNILLNTDLGYTTENIFYTENIYNAPREDVERLKIELQKMPEVANVSVSSYLPIHRMEGLSTRDINGDEDSWFSSRAIAVDNDFFETMDMKIIAGENVGESSNNYTRALVNETFAKKIGWTDSPVGENFITRISDVQNVEIIGVIKDFKVYTLYNDEVFNNYPPVIIFPLEKAKENWLFGWNRVIVKLHQPDENILARLNQLTQGILNKPNAFFINYQSQIENIYRDTLIYRNSIIATSIILLIITALGLLGFTQDEINRRTKEIAIRKIVGATAKDVLINITKGIVFIAIPALLIGFGFSYLVGAEWLKQFAVKVPLNLFLFSSSALLILMGIIVCVTLRSWHVVNENPIKNLRME